MMAHAVGIKHDPFWHYQTVNLNCGHPITFSMVAMPQSGELVWCFKCDEYRHRPFPLETGADGMPVLREWEWKCATGRLCNCGVHKYGQDERGAYAGARKHSVNRPGHEVWVISPIGCVRDRWTVNNAALFADEEVVKDARKEVGPRR
jgi:hypothetical protein